MASMRVSNLPRRFVPPESMGSDQAAQHRLVERPSGTARLNSLKAPQYRVEITHRFGLQGPWDLVLSSIFAEKAPVAAAENVGKKLKPGGGVAAIPASDAFPVLPEQCRKPIPRLANLTRGEIPVKIDDTLYFRSPLTRT